MIEHSVPAMESEDSALESFGLYAFWISLGAVLYVQVGYPLLMSACGCWRRRRSAWIAELPTVTLIVPAYNEEAVIQKKLENSLALDYPEDRLEIIVANDGSDDATAEIVRGFVSRGVTLLEFSDRRGKATMLNSAVAAARGDFLLLCDANVFFAADALKELLHPMTNAAVGATTGLVRIASHESDFGEGETLYYVIERMLQQGETSCGSMVCVDGGMYLIRRDLYQALPADTILDDFTTSMRVINQGHGIVYVPTAVASENGTPSSVAEFWRRVRVTAGAVQSIKRGEWPSLRFPVRLWQYVSHKLLRWIEPALLATVLLANVLLWDVHGLYRGVLVTQLIFYVLAILSVVSRAFRETKIGGIPFYFAMSHVAMFVGLVSGLFNRQRVTWRRTDRVAADAGS